MNKPQVPDHLPRKRSFITIWTQSKQLNHGIHACSPMCSYEDAFAFAIKIIETTYLTYPKCMTGSNFLFNGHASLFLY